MDSRKIQIFEVSISEKMSRMIDNESKMTINSLKSIPSTWKMVLISPLLALNPSLNHHLWCIICWVLAKCVGLPNSSQLGNEVLQEIHHKVNRGFVLGNEFQLRNKFNIFGQIVKGEAYLHIWLSITSQNYTTHQHAFHDDACSLKFMNF
jgi:hypothetical protein